MNSLMNTWTPGDGAQSDVDDLKEVVKELKKRIEILEKALKGTKPPEED